VTPADAPDGFAYGMEASGAAGQDPEYLRVLPLLFGIDAQLKVAEAVVEAAAAAACGGAATAARS